MSEARLVACREKALGILAVVFVAGVATGVLGTRTYDRSVAKATVSPLEQETAVAMERLSRDLSLNEQQAGKVKMILDEYIMLEADLMGQMRSLQQQGQSEIVKVLDAEQRTKFETMIRPVSTSR